MGGRHAATTQGFFLAIPNNSNLFCWDFKERCVMRQPSPTLGARESASSYLSSQSLAASRCNLTGALAGDMKSAVLFVLKLIRKNVRAGLQGVSCSRPPRGSYNSNTNERRPAPHGSPPACPRPSVPLQQPSGRTPAEPEGLPRAPSPRRPACGGRAAGCLATRERVALQSPTSAPLVSDVERSNQEGRVSDDWPGGVQPPAQREQGLRVPCRHL